MDNENEYMISDNDPLCARFMSMPREMVHFTPTAWMGGVVEGLIESGGFECRVSVHPAGTSDHPQKTIFLVRFV